MLETIKLQSSQLFSNIVFLLFLGAVIDTVGDLLMKQWVETNSKAFYGAGMACYIVGLSCLAYSFTQKNIVVASAIFVVLNLVLLTFASWIFYGEIINKKEFIGIALGISAILFLDS